MGNNAGFADVFSDGIGVVISRKSYDCWGKVVVGCSAGDVWFHVAILVCILICPKGHVIVRLLFLQTEEQKVVY